MNRRSRAAIAALISVLVGTGTIGLLAAPAGAAIIENDRRVPLTLVLPPIGTPPECNVPGDLITPTSGYLHFLLTGTVNTNNFSGKVKVQPQGGSGADADGNVYNLVGGTQEITNIKGTAFFSDHFVDDFYLIGKGSAPDVKLHENFLTTADIRDPTNPIFRFKVEQSRATC